MELLGLCTPTRLVDYTLEQKGQTESHEAKEDEDGTIAAARELERDLSEQLKLKFDKVAGPEWKEHFHIRPWSEIPPCPGCGWEIGESEVERVPPCQTLG